MPPPEPRIALTTPFNLAAHEGSITVTRHDVTPTLYRLYIDVDEETLQDLASGFVRRWVKSDLKDCLRWFDEDQERADANVARATRKAAK